jgi:hypothetical protein
MTIEDKGTFSEKLDEVFDQYRLTIKQGLMDGGEYPDVADAAERQAKQAIIALVEDWVIGEDIPEHWLTRGQSKQRKIGANNAKAAMRKRLHEGGGDDE